MNKQNLSKIAKAVKTINETLWEDVKAPDTKKAQKARNLLVEVLYVNGWELTLDYKLKVAINR
jgi:hypothetical protein